VESREEGAIPGDPAENPSPTGPATAEAMHGDRRRNPVLGLALEIALRAHARLAANEAYRRACFGDDLGLLDGLLAELGVEDPHAVEIAHRERTMASFLRRARGYYAELPAARQRAWMPLSGEVETVLRAGRALLVATHFGAGLLTPLALSRLGLPILVVARPPRPTRLRASLTHPCLEIVDLDAEPGPAAAGRVLARLREGGVVFIAGDLGSGSPTGDVDTNLLGRPTRFSRGFAEIALSARVRPTPIFSRIDTSGRILTWLEAPLDAVGATRRERAASLVHAYADRATEMLRRHPGNASPPRVRLLLEASPAPEA